MEVASSAVNIADDDGEVYTTPPKSSKGKRIADPILGGAKRAMIDLSDDDSYGTLSDPSDEISDGTLGDPSDDISDGTLSDPSDDDDFDWTLSDPSDDIQIPRSKLIDTFRCDICTDTKLMTEIFTTKGCTHSYCKQCMSMCVESSLQNNIFRISCPALGCDVVLEPYDCHSILPKQVFDRWSDALCEQLISGSQKFYCPFQDCSAVLLIDENNLVVSQSKCPECRRLFCAKCRVPWHSGLECKDFLQVETMASSSKLKADDLVQETSKSIPKSQPSETKLDARIANFISLVCKANNTGQQTMGTVCNANNVDLTVVKRQYERLRCKLLPVEVGSQEYFMIENYLRNTHVKQHSSNRVDIVHIFRASRPGETERFQKFSNTNNRMLLWHGSPLSNWPAILSKGLRIPDLNPLKFVKGIYFADMFSKSIAYCQAKSPAVLLLCEVALGDMCEGRVNYVGNLPPGKLSAKLTGSTVPDFAQAQMLEDGVIVPMGKPNKTPNKGCSFMYNEYIVYNEEQIRMRYVIHVEFK